MHRKKLRTLFCALAAAGGLTAFAATAPGGAGSKGDPLVTLSYLNEAFTSQIMEKVDGLLAGRNARLLRELAGDAPGGAAYAAVTLEPGQTLSGKAGCETLLRSGEAVCGEVPAPGLSDATAGGSLPGGAALQANHLYLMTAGGDVTAASRATLLVRGEYQVG